MKDVDLYLKVRHAVRIEGLSERAAARRFGIDPRTVNKMMKFSVPPGYVRKKPPAKPKLDPFIVVIDGILGDDKLRPKKQQHTARRLFNRGDGYALIGGAIRRATGTAGWLANPFWLFYPSGPRAKRCDNSHISSAAFLQGCLTEHQASAKKDERYSVSIGDVLGADVAAVWAPSSLAQTFRRGPGSMPRRMSLPGPQIPSSEAGRFISEYVIENCPIGYLGQTRSGFLHRTGVFVARLITHADFQEDQDDQRQPGKCGDDHRRYSFTTA